MWWEYFMPGLTMLLYMGSSDGSEVSMGGDK